MIKIFITEDHELYLEGLALLLKKQQDITIIGTSLTGHELLLQLPHVAVDILLLDVNLPDIEEETLIKNIREINADVKVIYLTLMRGTRSVHKLTKHDVQGYVLKSASVEELHGAIREVYNGGTYYSKDIDITVGHEAPNTGILDNKKAEDILSRREIEVLKLVCKEYSNADIAEKLFLSISTVETHRKNLIAKLGVNNTVGLVKFAIKHNLVT